MFQEIDECKPFLIYLIQTPSQYHFEKVVVEQKSSIKTKLLINGLFCVCVSHKNLNQILHTDKPKIKFNKLYSLAVKLLTIQSLLRCYLDAV